MASFMPTKALTALNQGKVVVGTDSFKVMLGIGSLPNRDTTQQYSDISASEASGTNYTAGGAAITLTAADYTTSGVHQSAVAAGASTTSWSTVSLTAVTWAAIYDTTPATKYVMAVFDFGGAQSVTANNFTLNWIDTTPPNRVWYLSAS